jgi:hypothetical protein
MLFKRTSDTSTDTIMVQVANGRPCGYDTKQVTTADIRAIEDAPGLMSKSDRALVFAYYRAGGK